ncbi:COP9 signalosome [Mycena rebaudengoi]|nr:COP9 signalosome [Mycena rebaudengoi]
MSTAGPPTPPPQSNATEIQDAARTVAPPIPAASAASSSTSAPATAPRPDHYTHVFPQIASLASERNLSGLIKLAEYHDTIGAGERQPTRMLVMAPLVLAYLICDDLPPARCALMRLPNNLASLPLVKQLCALVASTWERKHENVYVRSQALAQLVGQPDFMDTSLGALLGLMITIFLDSFRDRTFTLLSKAYTSLPLPLAQMYLGLPPEELLTVATDSGWAFDTSTQILSPVPPKARSGAAGNGFSPFSTLATFDFVADSVAKLET